MKTVLAIMVFITAIIGCKQNLAVKPQRKNATRKPVKMPESPSQKAEREQKAIVAALSEAQKAQYEDLAVTIECLTRVERDKNKLETKINGLLQEAGITRQDYDKVEPAMKLQDQAFAERLAAKVEVCVKQRTLAALHGAKDATEPSDNSE